MKRRGVVLKITALAILFLFVASAVQAGVKINLASSGSTSNGKNLGNTRSIWEDNFNDASKIDPNPPGIYAKSDNYTVSGGKVSMANTYAVWTDPSWTRMKQINVTNSAGQPLQNYALKMTINYDSDMKPDYTDIRFKHENDPGTWLNYWIENYSSTSIGVWVRIPSLPIGTSKLYLFYGNPSAVNQSNLGGVFSDWNIKWPDDEKITNHATNEGTWDPDVCFGNGEFLVAWEEGTTVIIKQEIRASIYDTNGDKPVNDALVFSDETTFYRNENPSIDYGGGKYFVAWEHFTNTLGGVTDPSTENIKGRTVVRNGGVLELGSVIDVCTAADCQADANVQFDSVNNRFCVVWEDARNGNTNYNIYGRLYDTSGTPVGGEKGIATTTYSQCEPWVAFDPIHEQYMIVWEEGITANNGPFSLKAGFFDETLTQIGSTITIATGSDTVDYNFPCVEFSQETQCFLVTWNNDDISSGDWWGNVWGKIYDASGNIVKNTFQISAGDFVRTDIAIYPKSNINDPFFVTYNDHYGTNNGKIYGKFVSANGDPSVSSVALSVSSSNVADWANIGVGNGKIFVAWEDIRDTSSDDRSDVYGNMWELTTSTGTSVTYSIGGELNRVLLAHVTSIAIQKDSSNFWETFNAISQGSTITYSILNGVTGEVIISNIHSGDSLSGVTVSSIRLMATFSRNNPSTTPQLDYWSVTWISNNPPTQPSNPTPTDGATGVGINDDLSWQACTDPDGDSVTYDIYFGTSSSPPMVYAGNTTCTYDPGTMVGGDTYYWQIVAKDTHGASNSGPVWSFTTWINHPPTQPSNPSPTNGATDVDINPVLHWSVCTDPDGDPVTYDVYFGISSNPPQIQSGLTVNSYALEDLSFGQLYYWKIVANDDNGGSNSSSTWNFTTRINHPPNVPDELSPADGATGVDINADLSWTGGDPDSGDTVTYDIYFGTSSPPPLYASDHEGTTYDPGQMQFNKKYYWQINATDDYGASVTGPIWNFTTRENGQPYPPTDPVPSIGATNVENNTVLSWSCNGDPDSGDTVTYDLYFGITNPPDVWHRDLTEKSYSVEDMSYNTKYYWKIVVKDNHGAETEGDVWDFTTKQGEINEPPSTPVINPRFTLIKPNKEYQFTIWATDFEGENVFYRISWGDETTTDWLGPYTEGEKQTFMHTWTITKPWSPIVITVSAKDVHDNKCKTDGVAAGLLPRNIQPKSGILLKFIQYLQEHHPLFNLLKRIIMWHPILNRLS